MRVTMLLNLWRAAGKILQKKRPGGNGIKTHFFMLCIIYLFIYCAPYLCHIPPFTSYISFLFLCYCSLRLAVQEDLEEEKRDEDELKQKKAKKQRTN